MLVIVRGDQRNPVSERHAAERCMDTAPAPLGRLQPREEGQRLLPSSAKSGKRYHRVVALILTLLGPAIWVVRHWVALDDAPCCWVVRHFAEHKKLWLIHHQHASEACFGSGGGILLRCLGDDRLSPLRTSSVA